MATLNETASRTCLYISNEWKIDLYKAFIEAFSDYVFPFALTEEQFANHLLLNGVDLERSVACFEDEKIVGFSLNGFGDWNGKSTVYDAGTGVLPEFRRQGVSREMFDLMMPEFKRDGIEQFLLEVITTNDAAIKLYEKLGFRRVRELALLQCDDDLKATSSERDEQVTIADISEPDWQLLCALWGDGRPSWQNSVDAVTRIAHMRTIAGAFVDDECVGYVAYSSRFGRIAQLAVDPKHRHRGIARRLIEKVKADCDPGYSLQVINVDTSIEDGIRFFHDLGFYERVRQYEMIRDI